MPNNAAAALELLAYDLSDALARFRDEHEADDLTPDVGPDDVLAALPAFLAALREQADRRDAAETGLPARFADAPRTRAGAVKHTCNGDDPRGLGFGRRDVERCARCWELADGAAPREDPAAGRRDRNRGYPTDAERAAHKSTCRACQTGGVCTAGEW